MTPGPWMVKKCGSVTEIWSDRGLVASCDLFPRGSVIADADAAAIAALPDIVAAAQSVIETAESEGWDRYRGTDEPRLADLKAALSKAQSQCTCRTESVLPK